MCRAEICSLGQATRFKTIQGYLCPHKPGLQASHAVCTMQRALNQTPDLPEAGKQSNGPALLRFSLGWQFSDGLGRVRFTAGL